MGRHLQVRVSASTFRPEDLEKDWPRLCALVWPDSADFGGTPMEQRGVVELATALYDCVRFSVADKTLQDRLLPVLEKTIRVRESLENALAAWDPKQADKLSTTLEDLLDELERLAPEPAFVISGTQNKKKRKAPWHRLIR